MSLAIISGVSNKLFSGDLTGTVSCAQKRRGYHRTTLVINLHTIDTNQETCQ